MKPHEFKKLKCHNLIAERWKPAPIVRGTGSGRNNSVAHHGVAFLYNIEPHKKRMPM